MNPKNKKSIEEKALEAADQFLATVPKSVLDKMIREVESMEFDSPTIQEYFGGFESEFDTLFPKTEFEEPICLHRIPKREFTAVNILAAFQMEVSVVFQPPGNLIPNHIKQTLEYSGVFCLDLHHA